MVEPDSCGPQPHKLSITSWLFASPMWPPHKHKTILMFITDHLKTWRTLFCFFLFSSQSHMVSILVIVQIRSRGSRLNIIIVAEGATDRQGQHITSDFVKDVSRAVFQTDTEGNQKLDQLVDINMKMKSYSRATFLFWIQTFATCHTHRKGFIVIL